MMALKLAVITCHASQVGDVTAVEGRLRRASPPSGTGKGNAYAEGFDHVVLPG